MAGELTGKVVMITGGGSGLGRASALLAVERGASVVLGDVNSVGLDESADAILTAGGDVRTLVIDVREKADCVNLADHAVREFGRLDGALCAAGISRFAPAMDMSLEQWQQVIDVNLTGVFLSTQAAARVMLDRGAGGSIVTFTSDLAIRGRPTSAHYVASKAGVIGLTKSFALALAPHGIRVNALAPGITDTPLSRAGNSDEVFAERARQIPLGRIGQPDDIARVACFLLSDASGWMTGQTLYANGGLVMP